MFHLNLVLLVLLRTQCRSQGSLKDVVFFRTQQPPRIHTELVILQASMGHKAELNRHFSPLAMLGLAFAILNSWTALSASLSLALPSGGPTSVIWGLITAGICKTFSGNPYPSRWSSDTYNTQVIYHLQPPWQNSYPPTPLPAANTTGLRMYLRSLHLLF